MRTNIYAAYVLHDINADGIPELIILNTTETYGKNPHPYLIQLIYTIADGKALLCWHGSATIAYVDNDGIFYTGTFQSLYPGDYYTRYDLSVYKLPPNGKALSRINRYFAFATYSEDNAGAPPYDCGMYEDDDFTIPAILTEDEFFAIWNDFMHKEPVPLTCYTLPLDWC